MGPFSPCISSTPSRSWTVLDLLLEQRTRNLTTLFGNQRDPTKRAAPTNPLGLNPARSENEVWSVVRQSLEAISCTAGVVRHAFRDGSPPLLLQLLQFYASESHVPKSIPTELHISTYSLLASLPGGTIFASLPFDIKAYRPFIDIKSSSATVDRTNVSSRLRSWLVDSCARGKGCLQYVVTETLNGRRCLED